MELAELEDRLRRLLGFSGYEARVYLAVLRLGAARPVEVAREAGVPVQRVYDVLRSLESKGFVYADSTGVYRPVDPADALGAYAARLVLDAVRRGFEVRRLAEELSGLVGSGGGEYVVLVRGVENAVAYAVKALEGCREKPVFMVYKALDRLRELWPLLVKLMESLPGGAVVLAPRDANIPESYLAEAASYGVEVVYSEAAIMDLMASCNTVVIGLPSPGGDVVAVVVKSREFAGALRARLLEIAGGR